MTGNILGFFETNGIRLKANGDRLKLEGPGDLPDKIKERALEIAKEHKTAILHLISKLEPGRCETCKAAGYWDHREYTGKGLLCFHYVMFLGKSGYPTPCSEARRACPLMSKQERAA